ncbi:hypothetical protein [Halomonas sp. OfavH-34-E]|uniref:hypothetical protein n=1 Tax=Halomonas sp. OfavH-34-E TaxID=2954491 RepID=UPI002097E99A|nr:hypothetical protein [Halomonas sp. OfavH-34-E]MCO7218113.1 hypothetical protein [Halomonas sp. OfavH-34-E]
MNNFEIHEKAQQLADTTSAYELARRLVEMEQDRNQLRGCFHSACEELTALKAALVDEGEEAPVGPVHSLLEKLKAERATLAETMDKICRMFGIGEAARTAGVLLTNVENAARFARYLHAVESRLLMVPGKPDEDFPDIEPDEECLVNSWGARCTDNYVEQFREALKFLAAAKLEEVLKQEALNFKRDESDADTTSERAAYRRAARCLRTRGEAERRRAREVLDGC